MKSVITVVLGLLALGCSSNSYAYEASTMPSDDRSAGRAAPAGAPMGQGDNGGYEEADMMVAESAPTSAAGGDWDGDYNFEGEETAGPLNDALAPARARYAQNSPPPQQQPSTTPADGAAAPERSDGVDLSGPLLVYTARFHLGVYEVTQTQDSILEQLGELDVTLARRSDTELVLRVPAARFQQAVDRVEGAGDVLHREINVQDVGEEFRDIAIRLRNAEVMRERLEQLLARADAVDDALAIERELQRLTDIIERFKGRQRFLADQITMSTITIVFQPLSTEPTGPDGFTLPFGWLNELGLSNLMRLR